MSKIITLNKEEVRVCALLGLERWLAKLHSTDRPNYAQGRLDGKLEHEILANVRANVCEWAVAKYYNVSWNVPWYPNELHPIRKDIADIGVNGEVRCIRTKTSIPFWEKDKDKFIFGAKVLVDNFTKIEVYNYFKAEDFMLPEYRDEDINGWRVPADLLQINN